MKRVSLSLAVLLGAVTALSAQTRERPRQRAGTRAVATANLATAAGYTTPKPDGSLSCTCNELARRLAGLGALVNASKAGALSGAEATRAESGRSEIESQRSRAESHLKEARGKGYAQQEELCGRGAGLVGSSWETWQPFLAQNGLDSDHYTGVKASNPDIPDGGDENKDGRGRFCNSGQWWEEDRALFAINGREGICKQKEYEIRQLLNAAEGERGHRCYEYKLK